VSEYICFTINTQVSPQRLCVAQVDFLHVRCNLFYPYFPLKRTSGEGAWRSQDPLSKFRIDMGSLYLYMAPVCLNPNLMITMFVHFGFVLPPVPIFTTSSYYYLLSWSMPKRIPLKTSISRSSLVLLFLFSSPEVPLIVLLTVYTL